MKRNLIWVMMILLLTGCKVEYNLNLNDILMLEESIEIIPTSDDDVNQIKNFNLNIPIYKEIDDYSAFKDRLEGIKYYNQERKKDKIAIFYKYQDEKYTEYIDSTLANLAYEYISVNKINDHDIVLSTSKEFLLFDSYNNLEEVKINIYTTYKVLNNNADSVNKHNYTWTITKDNAYGKGIYLKVDTSKEDLTFLEKLIRGDYFNIFTLFIIILIIGYIVFICFKKYSEKVDEI